MAAPATFAQTKPADDAAMLPLCTPGIAKGMDLESGLGLYEIGDGLLSADLVDEAGAKNCLKATSGNLSLDVDGVQLNLDGAVQYQSINGPLRRIVAGSLSPALCESYYSANDQFALELSNSNGDDQGLNGLLGGVVSLSYNLGSGTITPQLAQSTYGPWLGCHDATVANATSGTSGPDAIFRASFENRADLQVEYLDLAGTPVNTLTQTVNTDIVYKVRITNRGEAAAQGLRIREFVPKASGTLTPTMQTVSCVRDSDSQSCAAVGGDGTLHQNVASLAPGQALTYTLTRRVAGTSTLPAASGALTSVAAFVDPSLAQEARKADNARNLRIGLNTLPTFAVTASVSGTGGNITPATQQVVQGSAAALSVTPSATHDVDTVTDTCGAGGASAGTLSGSEPTLSYSVPNITAACAVTATFKLQQYAVSGNAGANGSLSVTTPVVDHGGTATFEVTPNIGYSAAVIGSAGCGTVTSPAGGGPGSAGPITAACSLSATFSQNSYTVTPTVVGGNGSISPNTPQVRAHGDNLFFTLTPDNNYRIDSVTGCGGNLSGNLYLISSVTANCTVTATFALITHAVTAGSLVDGSITITNSPVTHGQDVLFTVVPDTGRHLDGVPSIAGGAGCGTVTALGGDDFSAGPITQDGCSLSAAFAINEYDVVVSMTGSNGTIGDPAGTDPVSLMAEHGDTVLVRVTPDTGYHTVFTTTAGTCSFSDPDQNGEWESSSLSGDCEATVTFVINTYTVTAETSGTGGAITPPTQSVAHGGFTSFMVTPAAGFQIDEVTDTCGGGSLGAGPPPTSFYSVFAVTAACTVTATFEPLP